MPSTVSALHAAAHDARRQHVFVYGTLMRGGTRSLDAMPTDRAALIARAWVGGYQLAVPRGAPFPALVVHDVPGAVVHGELWRVDDATLVSLDQIERATPEYVRTDSQLYQRAVVRAHITHATDVVDAFAYVWNRADWPLEIIGPSWRAWRSLRVAGAL